jgi:hypothetical protein
LSSKILSNTGPKVAPTVGTSEASERKSERVVASTCEGKGCAPTLGTKTRISERSEADRKRDAARLRAREDLEAERSWEDLVDFRTEDYGTRSSYLYRQRCLQEKWNLVVFDSSRKNVGSGIQ